MRLALQMMEDVELHEQKITKNELTAFCAYTRLSLASQILAESGILSLTIGLLTRAGGDPLQQNWDSNTGYFN